VLLVDTYDTLEGVSKVIELAKTLGSQFRVKAIRLDSGDLRDLSIKARRMLDEAGLQRVTIFASGGLNEDEVEKLMAAGAPIDGFGVGADMGVSRDAPSLDFAYKLVEYDGQARMKLSAGKGTLPGRKQIFRVERDGVADHDVLGRRDEQAAGRPLLQHVMSGGKRCQPRVPLADARANAKRELESLPTRLKQIEPASPRYLVETSAALARDLEAFRRQHEREMVKR
jgi:nicotinate phosphoribosyltransferase